MCLTNKSFRSFVKSLPCPFRIYKFELIENMKKEHTEGWCQCGELHASKQELYGLEDFEPTTQKKAEGEKKCIHQWALLRIVREAYTESRMYMEFEHATYYCKFCLEKHTERL